MNLLLGSIYYKDESPDSSATSRVHPRVSTANNFDA